MNTFRATTAFARSKYPLLSEIPNTTTPRSGLGISTMVEVICQGIKGLPLPIADPMMSCITSAVGTAFAQHNKTNGSTVSIIHGDLIGKRLFAVSIHPGRTIQLWERPSWEQFFDFAKANLELLLLPNHAIGTWFDDRECVHVFDISICVPELHVAVALGYRFGQRAIFDLYLRREISIPSAPPIPSQNNAGDAR